MRSELANPMVDSPIQIGKWREDDILRTFGKPYQISHIESFDGVVWSWQMQQNYMPYLFFVYFNPAGVVVRYFVGSSQTQVGK